VRKPTSGNSALAFDSAFEAPRMKNLRRRSFLLSLFLLVLSWSFFTEAQAQRSVLQLTPVITEEGQLVVFDRTTWQQRELAKRLPLQEPWPTGGELGQALGRFGLDRNTPPASIPAPSKVLADIYVVGQDIGNNLTYMIDCGPEGVAIIDPSFESEFDKTVANVERCGRSKKDIRWVLNTHCHFDHSLADKKFREMGAEIIVHEADADAIEKGTRLTAFYRFTGQHGPAEFPRTKVDRRLSDGEEVRLGNKVFHVVHTPGHTPGSSCFLLQLGGKHILFAGDNLFYDGRLGWQGNPYADNPRYAASLQKLAKFTLDDKWARYDVLLPGHLSIVMDKAYLDVEKARDFAALDVAAQREIQSAPFSRPEYRRRMFGRPAVSATAGGVSSANTFRP
jgi:glyoxylase-like metal-dependent hydrolase (beta-lactamase superfamily II)